MSKLLFDVVPIKESKFRLVSHPYLSVLYSFDCDTGKVNDLHKPEELEAYKEELFEIIDAGDIYLISDMIASRWKMTWFKFCSQFMNQKDFGELLAYCWMEHENPNQDNYVSRQESVEYFRQAKKRYLMEPDELRVYMSLPPVVTTYRGVARGRERYGLSWTNDKEKAEWFQTRFGEGNCLLKADVPKRSILAYFNGRNEKEIVVDVFSIMDKIKEV